MNCGYLLRVNGRWMDLEGVQSGVPIARDRATSEFRSSGGRRSISRSPRASREWSLDFRHATPEAVRLAMLAANGQAGEVLLLDVSQARSNMLDPFLTIGPSTHPTIECGGLPLPSVVASNISTDVRIDPVANRWVSTSFLPPTTELLAVRNGTADAWTKFAVPAAAAGRTLVAARLELDHQSGPTPALQAHFAPNGWVDGYGTDYSDPVGAAMGTASFAGAGWSIPLGSLLAYQGVDLSLRIRSQTTGASATYMPSRAVPVTGPRLVLTYNVASVDHQFSALVRGGQLHTMSAWTNAAAGAEIGTFYFGEGTRTLVAPAGTGPRLASTEFTPTGDRALTGVVPGALATLVSALRLTEGAQVGPWIPGQKVPCKVAVNDPAQTLNMLLADEQGLSDYQVTLREVG